MDHKKNKLSGLMVAAVLLLVGVAGFYVLWPQLQPHATLRMGDGVFRAHVATTATELETGLSETSQLRSNEAMILVFDKDSKWSIWMKDMYYPIDIVWLNKNKEVVYIVKNAPADSYPDKFVPNTSARYVVELPAGTVDAMAIRTGSAAIFDENNLSGLKL